MTLQRPTGMFSGRLLRFENRLVFAVLKERHTRAERINIKHDYTTSARLAFKLYAHKKGTASITPHQKKSLPSSGIS